MYDYVEGATRLQKYGFLSAMEIKELRNYNFYDDWSASDYGPFSKKFAIDINSAINNGLIDKHHVKNRYDFDVHRFAVTQQGKNIVQYLKKEHSKLYSKIFEITSKYQSKSLIDLLQDVYYQYPNYAIASKIKAEIGKKIYESDSYLSKQYDNSDSEY